MATRPEVAWPMQALLGEGPAWIEAERALYFVDIKGRAIHRWHPGSGERRSTPVDAMPSFIVPASDGRMLVGCWLELRAFAGGELLEVVARIPEPQGNRSNDATVDHAGRLWFGTMDDTEQQPSGSIWCLERGRLRRAGGGCVVTNGPAVDDQRGLLYYCDSAAGTVWRHRIDAEGGLLAGEVFLQLPASEGYPDGIVVDAEGCVWVALWDGWGLNRYRPDGSLSARIDLPCARVTKIALGGADGRTAFVTTARVGLDAAQRAAQPLAGSLFCFEAPAPGRPLPTVQLAEASHGRD